jgi:hypothetical protein
MFNTHKLNEDGFREVDEFKRGMAENIHFLLSMLPEGREKSIFVTKIEEAMFFGTKAIASKPGNFTEIKEY